MQIKDLQRSIAELQRAVLLLCDYVDRSRQEPENPFLITPVEEARGLISELDLYGDRVPKEGMITVRFFGFVNPLNAPPASWDYKLVFCFDSEASEAIQDYLCEHDEGIAHYEMGA